MSLTYDGITYRSLEEQVRYNAEQIQLLIQEVKKINALNLKNGTDDVLIQTTDTNHSFKVMTDGRAKVQTAPVEDDDVVRNKELTERSKELEERSFVYYSVEAETARDYSKGGNIDKIFKEILKRIENLENKSI